MFDLWLAELVVVFDEVVRSEEEAAGAAGGVADDLAGNGLHDIHDGADEGARGKILPCAFVGRTRGLFEEAFVDGTLDVNVHAGPILVGDHLDDALKVGGVGDFVLGLAENDADEARFFAEGFEGVAVVSFEIVTALAAQFGPSEVVRDGVVEAQLGHLVGELEEEQVGDLFDVVAVTYPRVLENVGVVPDFGNDGG